MRMKHAQRSTGMRRGGHVATPARILTVLALTLTGSLAMGAIQTDAELVQTLPLDLDHPAVTGEAQWILSKHDQRRQGVLWTVPADQNAATVTYDLQQLGIIPNHFDELQVEFRTRESLVSIAPRLEAYPVPDMCRNWYSKIDLQPGEWTTARFDLRLDDDGIFFSHKPMEESRLLLTLHKRFLGTPGEPSVRQVEIAAIRFVRHPVTIDVEPTEAILTTDNGSLRWRYVLKLQNQLLAPASVNLALQPGTLERFSPDWHSRLIDLGPREYREIALTLSMAASAAADAPDLYSEWTQVMLRLPDRDLPSVTPLLGYRPKVIWATVPPDREPWRPAPPPASDKDRVIARAAAALDAPWGVPIHGPSGHPQSYIDKESNRKPTARSWFRHVNAEGEDITTPGLTKAYVGLIHADNFERADVLAQAWQVSGELRFAEAARNVFLEYCAWYPYLPVTSPASTSGRTRLHQSTLQTCFWFEKAINAYGRILDSPVLGQHDRQRIDEGFFRPELRAFYGHNVEYTNMQVHHYQTYTHGAVVLDRYWNLVGEALYGSHGFYTMIERTFTEDGISHEAGVYHWFTLKPMMDFVHTMDNFGIDVMNARFKRVFDGTLANTPDGVVRQGNLASLYPRAYKAYRDPDYIPTLKASGQWPPDGMDPDAAAEAGRQARERLTANTLQPANGYLWLRESSTHGFRALSINYIMQRDRHEHDRLHVELFDPDRLTYEMFRITYGSKHASLMSKTFGHNTFVIGEEDQLRLPSRLDAFLDRPALPAALITEQPGSVIWPGTRFARCVAILDGIFFIGDLIDMDSEQDVDWPFYAPWEPWVAEGVGILHPSVEVAEPFESTYPFAEDTRFGAVSGALTAWATIPRVQGISGRPKGNAGAEKTLHLTYAPMDDATVVTGTLPRGYRPEPGPFFFVRQTRRKTAQCGMAVDVTDVQQPSRVKRVARVTVTTPDGEKIPEHQAVAWRIVTDETSFLVVVNRTGESVRAAAETIDQTLFVEQL